MQAFGKGIYWTILVLIFGLLQLWIDVFLKYYGSPDSFSFYPLIKNGAFLFFSLAVVVGITIDYHFDEKKSEVGALWKAGAFVFFPFLLVVAIVVAYTTVSLIKTENDNIIRLLNYISFCLTLLYALLGKTYLFLNNRIS